MAITFILSSTNSEFTGATNFGKKLVSATTETAGNISFTLSSSAIASNFAWTDPGIPGIGGLNTGTFTVQVNVTTANSNIGLIVQLARVNSSGVVQVSSTASASQTLSTTGVKTFTFNNPALGTWVAGDRLRVLYQFTNTAMNSQTVAIGTGTSNDTVATPFFAPYSTLYWVGSSGTWDYYNALNWAATSGGTGGISYPTDTTDVVFDNGSAASSFTVTTATIGANLNPRCRNLTVSSNTAPMALALGSTVLDVYGNLSFSNVSPLNITGGSNALELGSATASTTTTANFGTATIGCGISINAATNSIVQLLSNLNIPTNSASALTLVQGTLDTNSKTIYVPRFVSTGFLTRGIAASGPYQLQVWGNSSTVATITGGGASYGSGSEFSVNLVASSTTGTRTISCTAGGVSFIVSGGSDTVTFTSGDTVRSLSFSGFTGTWSNVAMTIILSLTIPAGMITGSGTGIVTFTGSGTITAPSVAINFPININSPLGTVTLGGDLAQATSRSFSLTQGTLALGSYNLYCGTFSSTGSLTRSITHTGSSKVITTSSSGTVLTLTGSEATWAGTTPVTFSVQGGASGQTQTLNVVDITARVEVYLQNNCIVTFTPGNSVWSLIFTATGSSGTWANVPLTIRNTLVLVSNMTVGSGSNTLTFDGGFANASITSSGKTLDFPVTFNLSNNWSLTLNDSLTIGATRTATLTGGTLNLGANNLSTGIFSSTGTAVRGITRTTGVINITGSSNTVTTITGSNLTIPSSFYVYLTANATTGTRTINNSNSSVGYIIQAGSDSVSFTATNSILGLEFSNSFTGTWTNVDLGIFSDLITSTNMTIGSGGNTVTKYGGNIYSNSKVFDFPLRIIDGTTLQQNLTVGSTRTVTLNDGPLNLNNFVLKTGYFSSSSSNVRNIGFGTAGRIELTTTVTGTVWNTATPTNLSYSGTPSIWVTGSAAITRTINTGTVPEAEALNWSILPSDGIVTFTNGNSVKNLTLNGTFSLSNTSLTIYGEYFANNVTLTTGTNAWTFAKSSGTQNISGGLAIHNFPVVFNSANATFKIVDSLFNCSAATFTQGGLDISDFGIALTTFNSDNSNVRSINFGTNKEIIMNSTSGGNWNLPTLTNMTFTGTPTVRITGNSATTRTILHGNTAGGNESNALNVIVTSGSASIATSQSHIADLVYTSSFTGSQSIGTSGVNIYGNIQLSSNGTFVTGTQVVIFKKSSGTQTVDFNGISASGLSNTSVFAKAGAGTLQLSSDLNIGLAALTVAEGGFDANDRNLSIGSFNSSNINLRLVQMGNGTWTLNDSGSVWDVSDTTNLTLVPESSTININISNSFTRAFIGGDLSYNNINISGSGTGAILELVGSNTFNTISSTKLVAYRIALDAGSTTTVDNWAVNGSSGQKVTLNTNVPGTRATLAKSNSARIDVNYYNLQDIQATPTNTWYALTTNNNTDLGNNLGWTFSGIGAINFIAFF